MQISNHMRQFRIWHLMVITVSESVAFASLQINSDLGVGCIVLVTLFWFGVVSIWISNSIQPEVDLEDKGFLAAFFEQTGLTAIFFTFCFGLLFCFFAVVGVVGIVLSCLA